MSETHVTATGHDKPWRCELRIKGHLDDRWADWFEGLTFTHESDGTTILHGPVADQAALHGLLRKVRDLGLPLIAVIQVDPKTGSGPDTQVMVGAFFEVILALAIVGIAVALFPVVKRQNEGVALGYVGLRTLEAGIIAVGVVPLLAVVTLRQHLTGTAGTDTATLVTLGNALVAFHNWTFLLGPSYVCGTNTVLMAYLMYRSGLVPRFIPVLGLVGGPLVFASGAAQMFGIYEQISVWAAIAAVPVFA
jgi:hypothetical protein